MEMVPMLLGLAAALTVAVAICPVPRSVLITPERALGIAALYLVSVFAAGTVTYAFFSRVFRAGTDRWLRFAVVTVWVAPLTAYYVRRTYWAVWIAIPLAVLLTGWLERHERRRPLWAVVAAGALLEAAAACYLGESYRLATWFAAAACGLVIWFYRSEHLAREPRKTSGWRLLAAVAAAFLFTAASLTPYLRLTPGAGAGLLAPVFQDDQPAAMATVARSETWSGMILRPRLADAMKLVAPPPPSRRAAGPMRPHPKEPLDIPFYGAYWFYRERDRRLPHNAAESRGEPTDVSFRATDYTPMKMEARQNFGKLIDLSCCEAIELTMLDKDPRPNTVSVVLILTNTRTPDRQEQNLGIFPVQSTLRFPVPSRPALAQFDEAIIRFIMHAPRRMWSAKIAVTKFRLLPRGR